MSVEARTKPLHQPLPGGSEGATVKLHPMLTGELRAPPSFVVRDRGKFRHIHLLGIGTPKSKWEWLPVPSFLIEHPTAGLVLVDGGYHQTIAVDPAKNLGKLAARLYTVRATVEQSLPKRLEAMGLSPSAIQVVIMTHLHFDHASGISEFPEATFIIGEGEWQWASGRRPLLRGYIHRHFDLAFDYREVQYSRSDAGVSSYATFGRSVDLFGDGSIRLCYTPGHTMGHQSVIARLRDREVLLTGDAAMVRRNYRELLLPGIPADEHRSMVSLREIQLYEKQNPDSLIIPGHDSEAWGKLQPLYE